MSCFPNHESQCRQVKGGTEQGVSGRWQERKSAISDQIIFVEGCVFMHKARAVKIQMKVRIGANEEVPGF